MKYALTPVLPSRVSVHGPVPLQPPLHPEKFQPEVGVAFNVTCVNER